jgi:leader peptidase (prepilin peptidase)/N-methyltransferase
VRPIDNIPIASYLILRGRCRSCGAKFSPRYLLVELLTAVLSGIIYWKFVVAAPEVAPGVRMARYGLYFVFMGVLLVLSFIDFDTKRLPDVITLPATVVLFAAGFGAHAVPWMDRAIGALAGYLAVRIISDGYYYLTGREGLGLGDGKLLAVIGAVLGWRAIPIVIFAASFFGIAVSVPLLLARRASATRDLAAAAAPTPAASTLVPDPGAAPALVAEVPPPGLAAAPTPVRHAEVPFGPFLSASALGYLLFSEPVWLWVSRGLLGI